MRLLDVCTGRLSGLKYKLICCFKLAVDMVGGGGHQGVCELHGWASIPGKGADGIGVDGY